MTVRSDWQSLCAVATIVSKTGCTSLGEREITPSTSPVAVCRSSDSCSSLVRRPPPEQPGVLDRNHRLISEGFDQCDLLLFEGGKDRTSERDCTYGLTLSKEGTANTVRRFPPVW